MPSLFFDNWITSAINVRAYHRVLEVSIYTRDHAYSSTYRDVPVRAPSFSSPPPAHITLPPPSTVLDSHRSALVARLAMLISVSGCPCPNILPGSASTQQIKRHAPVTSLFEPFGRAAAIGLLRSYAYLVQHQSYFITAHQHHLIPPSVSWVGWSQFIACFRDMEDHDVSNRYHYGQLLLSRLHWAVRLCQPRAASTTRFYYLPHWPMTPYLRSILAPLAFAFATLSLVLSVMQVVVPIPAKDLGFSGLNESDLKRKYFLDESRGNFQFCLDPSYFHSSLRTGMAAVVGLQS